LIADAGIDASYLITFRDADGARLPLLRLVTAWLANMPWMEVIVVEQDAEPRIDPAALGSHVDSVFVRNAGPFNKSWGLNVAARRAAHDLLVTGDADMIMAPDALNRALLVCRDHFDAVNPYANLVDLTEAETRAVVDGELGVFDIGRERLADRQPEGEHICFCGGICVFRREVYFALGGMDERFVGWGGEDDAMSANLERYTRRIAAQKDTLAYHLWHPRPAERYRHDNYRRNLEMANHYRLCDAESLERRRAGQRANMGDPGRYAQG